MSPSPQVPAASGGGLQRGLSGRRHHGTVVQVDPRACKHGVRRRSPWVSDSTPRV
jgi:hypothetical protein